MSNKEKEFDDYPGEVYANKEAFLKRFRILEGKERDEHRRRIEKAISGGTKSRVTIYFDNSVIDHFKELAEKEKIGYQTLINDTLRRLVDTNNRVMEKRSLKDELLKDKKFLQKLKMALAA